MLSRNDGGVWGEDPTIGLSQTLVVRSTEITVDGAWHSLGAAARRSLSLQERQSARLLEGDIVVTKASGSADHIGKSAIVTSELASMGAAFGNFMQRLRTRPERLNPRYLHYYLQSSLARFQFNQLGTTSTGLLNLSGGLLSDVRLPLLPLSEQQQIVDFLDDQVGRIEAIIAAKIALVVRLNERIDAQVSARIGVSKIAGGSAPAVEVRRVLRRARRMTEVSGEMITAFRDGQVTSRFLRREDGFTDAWTRGATYQRVQLGDVVVHGLDGFAGAIGTSEADGVCSPVYHVLKLAGGGDTDFYGRLLRVLAVTDYLGLFAVSTRERAVDFRNWDLFGRIPVPLVDLPSQLALGDEIRAVRPLRPAMDASIDLLKERKRSLITAAVTGEFDVSTASGRGVA